MISAPLFALAVLQGSAPPSCPSGAEALKELDVSGSGWVTACRVISDRRRLLVGVHGPDASATDVKVVAAILAQSSPAIRAEFGLEGSESAAIQAVAKQAEEWKVVIEEGPWGPDSLLRIGVLGSGGDDLFLGQEIVTFLRLEGRMLVPVWTGLGDRMDRRFDSCVLESTAKFSRLSDGRLERVTITRRTFRNAGVDRGLAADLRRECVAAPRRRDVFIVRPVGAQ